MIENMVSVVVPMYNSERCLQRTLDGILSQTYSNLEIILVDDGSADRTREICNKTMAGDDRVHYHIKENGGVASARNFGVNKSRGEFIAFCDHDDVWIPEKIALQVPCFENSDVGLVYGALDGAKYSGRCFEELLLYNCIPSSSVMVRRSCFDVVGLFDERREMSGVDDKHMWVRIASRYDVICLGQDLYYRGLGQNYSDQQDKMLKAELSCLSDLVTTNVNLFSPACVKQAYYNMYSHYANNFMFINEYTNARNCYFQAIRYKLAFNAILLFLLMCLPCDLINYIKKQRKKLIHSL